MGKKSGDLLISTFLGRHMVCPKVGYMYEPRFDPAFASAPVSQSALLFISYLLVEFFSISERILFIDSTLFEPSFLAVSSSSFALSNSLAW